MDNHDDNKNNTQGIIILENPTNILLSYTFVKTQNM